MGLANATEVLLVEDLNSVWMNAVKREEQGAQ